MPDVRWRSATTDGLRIVLFGLPGAGKSSLLAVLGLAADSLAAEVGQSDTLVLAVDASSSAEALENNLAAFDHFLRELEAARSARAEVGGLPVFLVLTKCDLLAQPNDRAVDWMERVEQRKREIAEHFHSFLTRRNSEAGPLPFGQLDLHLWATAIKRPGLAGAAAKPSEPYGVAELLGQCLDCAAAFRRRRERSSRHLFWIAGASISLPAVLMLLALFLVFGPGPKPPSELQRTIEALQFADKPTPAERLRAPLPALRLRRQQLERLEKNPEFATLPENLRTFVVQRHKELDLYLEWLDQLQAIRRPVTVDTMARLLEIKAKLEKLQLPQDWRNTPAGRLYREQFDEINALLDGVRRVQTAYLGDAKKAFRLWSFDGYQTEGSINWRLWSADLEDLRRQFKLVTFKPTDKLPGSPALTYAAVLRFDAVQEASTLRQRLDRVRDLCAALGLIGPFADKPPVLVFEKPPAFKLPMAQTRLEELQKAYPRYKTDFVRNGLPAALVRELERAVPPNYEFLLEPARALILSQWRKAGDGEEETAARWNAVRDWLLGDPEELAAWRSLAIILVQLLDPYAADPVTALAAFLGEALFSLEIKRITLELPDDSTVRIPATAALSIYHPRTSGKEPALVFEQPSEATRDAERRVLIYTFELKKGTRIIYQLGDKLSASLPARDNMQLMWSQNRSSMYQFERLLRPPRLHKADKPTTTGELLDDARVLLSPPDGWPRVPELLPAVPRRASQ